MDSWFALPSATFGKQQFWPYLPIHCRRWRNHWIALAKYVFSSRKQQVHKLRPDLTWFPMPIKSALFCYLHCMDIDLTGFSRAQQHALFDLLILAMYADWQKINRWQNLILQSDTTCLFLRLFESFSRSWTKFWMLIIGPWILVILRESDWGLNSIPELANQRLQPLGHLSNQLILLAFT